MEVSQEETIGVSEFLPVSGSGNVAWQVKFAHSIDLDFHSITDKRESSVVNVFLDRNLCPVGSAKWSRLKSFHARPNN